MATVSCPECGQALEVQPGAKAGDLIDCPFCAGLSLRLSERERTWTATIVKKASCVLCDKVLILPDDVKPGDVVECCGVKQRVTYEYGAYALEKV